MKLSRFEVVAIVSVILAVGHVAFEQKGIDQSVLLLLAAAAVCYLIPEVALVFSRLRKLKVGGVEAEFEQEIRRFEEKVVAAEQQASSGNQNQRFRPAPLHSSYVNEYTRIVSSPTSAREKIVLGGVLAERMVTETIQELQLDSSGRLPARLAIDRLLKEGLISQQEGDAFAEFWKVRNTVVHGSAEELSDYQLSRVLDLLWRLVSIFG